MSPATPSTGKDIKPETINRATPHPYVASKGDQGLGRPIPSAIYLLKGLECGAALQGGRGTPRVRTNSNRDRGQEMGGTQERVHGVWLPGAGVRP